MMWFLVLSCFVYILLLGAAVYFTHPPKRRVIGALAGGVAAGLSLPFIVAIADAQGWWRCPFLSLAGAPLLTFLGFSLSYAAVALVFWRIEHRFGWRGTAYSLAAVCVIGPPRDYAIASLYPNLMVFGHGIAPIIGNAAAYLFTLVLTLSVMRLIAGPNRTDRLAPS